jgi:signal transduction histidine kinase/CheY-like chemotaxis protein
MENRESPRRIRQESPERSITMETDYGGSYTVATKKSSRAMGDGDDRSSLPNSSSQQETAKCYRYDPHRVFSAEQLNVFDVLVHPVWIFDIDRRCMRWANLAALEMWDAKSLEELQNRSFHDMSESTLTRLKEYQIKFEQGQHVVDHWTLYPLGKAKHLQLYCSGIRLDSREQRPSMLVEGISFVKDVEDEVMKETLRGVEMLRHLPLPVCQFDLQGKVVFQNPAAVVIEDIDTEDASENQDSEDSSSSINSDMAPDISSSCQENCKRVRRQRDGGFVDRFLDPAIGRRVLEKLQNGNESTADLRAQIHTNHGPRWSAIQLRKTVDPVTGDSAILYSARDISDAIEAKKQREAKERKSEFLAIMAHEIRTPLHQIIGFTDLLDQTTTLDNDQKSYVKLLKQCSQGLLTVISDVLDYSKLEAGKMKIEHIPYEPKSVMEGTIAVVQASCEEKNLFLTLEWSKDVPFRLFGDPNRLRQILINLLSNAVKFTEEGGIHVQAFPDISVNSQPTSKKRKKSTGDAKQGKQMIKFVITDTGTGILEEHQTLIFHRYHQGALSVAREHGGTGLGLSICKLLVGKMGGEIGLESQAGIGSSFWFNLPADLPPDVDVVEPVEDEALQLEGMKVLVAEDNHINQKLVKRMLERLGHHPTIAVNGKMAIECVQQSMYDVVLMDIQMPIMDGLEATRRLRMLGYNDLPILGLTASVARPDFSELGFDDWLPKPVPMKDLKSKLYKIQQASAAKKGLSNGT